MPSLSRALSGVIGLGCTTLLALGLAQERPTERCLPAPVAALAERVAPPMPDLPPVATDAPSLAKEPGRPAAPVRATPGRRRVYRVTAYCDPGTTASGTKVGVGQCAAPVDIPFGTELYIPALGRKFVVTDRTHRRFRHNTVDLFIASERRCEQFGCRYLDCEIRWPRNGTGWQALGR